MPEITRRYGIGRPYVFVFFFFVFFFFYVDFATTARRRGGCSREEPRLDGRHSLTADLSRVLVLVLVLLVVIIRILFTYCCANPVIIAPAAPPVSSERERVQPPVAGGVITETIPRGRPKTRCVTSGSWHSRR